ncbi:MAG TPA: YbdK family carboxylate-amine ligase, partial [Usitatibacter sp.]
THDYNLVRGAPDLLARLEKMKLGGEVKPEITESMIEVNSSVKTRYDDLLAELTLIRDAIVGAADKLNFAVCGGGAHPFHLWKDQRIYPTERFQRVSELYGYLAKQFTVFGQHIHLGVTSGDDAVYLTHQLAPYIPHFIALSASSPFSQGEDTSFETSRLHAVASFPLAGQLPPVNTWAEFNTYFDAMKGYGIVASMKDFYWDIRPKPEYGTVEIRICDTPLTVDVAAQLAAYAQTIAKDLLDNRRKEPVDPMYRVYGYNRFQACRFGYEGELVSPFREGRVRVGDDIIDTLKRLAPTAPALGTAGALAALGKRVAMNANDSLWLRERYKESKSLPDVVRLQAKYWRDQPPPQ